MGNKKSIIISIVVLITLFVVGTYMYKENQTQKMAAIAKENAKFFERDYSVKIGNPKAKVQLVEFFDPACGTCAQFHPYIKQIMKENKDNIRLVLRYAPFHKGSDNAVRMLEAARKQGKFMSTLELMFDTQQYWIKHHEVNPEILWRILSQSDLDMEQLAKDFVNPKINDIIIQDLADAKKLNASKTPSYYVNTKPLQTFGLEQLKELINSEL